MTYRRIPRFSKSLSASAATKLLEAASRRGLKIPATRPLTLIKQSARPEDVYVHQVLVYFSRDLFARTKISHNFYSIRSVILSIGNLTLAELPPRIQDSYFRLRLGNNESIGSSFSRASAYRDLVVLRSALNFAHKTGKLRYKPYLKLLPPPKESRVVFRGMDFAAIFRQKMPPHIAGIIRVAAASGERIGAVTALKKSQIDLAKRVVNFRSPETASKTKRRIVFAYPRKMDRFFKMLVKGGAGPNVFTWGGKAIGHSPIKTVARIMRRASVDQRARAAQARNERLREDLLESSARLKSATSHTLRRTLATNMALKTRNFQMVQTAMGHSNSRTTERYVHLADDPDKLRGLVDFLSRTFRRQAILAR